MPIVGMTRREDIATPKFPDLGKLRKGGPKTDPKKPGPDLDYWRFTSERQDVQTAFNEAYGAKPKIVSAYLPFAKMEENWLTWFEEYDAGGMLHRCDGVTINRRRRPDGQYEDGQWPCPYHADPSKRTKDRPGCKQVGRLNLIIPELIRAGFVGFVAMETHSINDLISITACLLDAENKAGKLSGILFNVIRVKQTISTPAWKEEDKDAGKRNRTVKDLVKVVPAAEWVMARMQVEAEQQMALAQGKTLQITAGAPVEDVEDGDYEDDDMYDEVELDGRDPEVVQAAMAQDDPPQQNSEPSTSEPTTSDKLFADIEEADPPITKAQYREIGELVEKCYVTDKDKKNFVLWMKDMYGTTNGKELTTRQATELLNTLKAAAEKAGK
jgi:hypothetical protein